MRSIAVAAVMALTVLAGCAGPDGTEDFSSERIVLSVAVINGTFEANVPLWLAPDGATPQDWADRLETRQGVEWQMRDTPRGPALWIRSNQTITLEANGIDSRDTGASAEAYVDGTFSLGTGDKGLPWLEVLNGSADVFWNYEADSDQCSVVSNHFWLNVTVGVHLANDKGQPASWLAPTIRCA